MYPKALATLHSADNLDFAAFVKFRGLPLRFRDNLSVHCDSDASLGRIQVQGDEQVVDVYIKANLFGFAIDAYFHIFQGMVTARDVCLLL